MARTGDQEIRSVFGALVISGLGPIFILKDTTRCLTTGIRLELFFQVCPT